MMPISNRRSRAAVTRQQSSIATRHRSRRARREYSRRGFLVGRRSSGCSAEPMKYATSKSPDRAGPSASRALPPVRRRTSGCRAGSRRARRPRRRPVGEVAIEDADETLGRRPRRVPPAGVAFHEAGYSIWTSWLNPSPIRRGRPATRDRAMQGRPAGTVERRRSGITDAASSTVQPAIWSPARAGRGPRAARRSRRSSVRTGRGSRTDDRQRACRRARGFL